MSIPEQITVLIPAAAGAALLISRCCGCERRKEQVPNFMLARCQAHVHLDLLGNSNNSQSLAHWWGEVDLLRG